MRLVANKDYWRGAPKVDEVIFQTYQNQDTMAQDLKTGAIQTGWNIPSAQFNALNSDPNLEAIRAVTIGFDELGFNCADKKVYPKSTGNPVLQDPAFRSALQWAIDKEKIVSIGYNGNAAPADTIVTRDFYSAEADYHLTPASPYTFDLDKARQALDAAGYPDANGDGIREYKGKPIKLRLYARSESPESQNCGKLITGWFKDIGLDIDYQVIDDGALGDKQYNYDGNEYAPDFDMFIWGWGGDVDPNFILSVLTTDSIENWSDCVWSNAEYDKLFLQQQTTLDVQERIAIVKKMQQIVYDESPYIPLVYPLDLEAANTGTWTGWARANENKGAWWYNTQPDTYMAVHPASDDPCRERRRVQHRSHRGVRGRGDPRGDHRRPAAPASEQARRDGVTGAPAVRAGAEAGRRERPAAPVPRVLRRRSSGRGASSRGRGPRGAARRPPAPAAVAAA